MRGADGMVFHWHARSGHGNWIWNHSIATLPLVFRLQQSLTESDGDDDPHNPEHRRLALDKQVQVEDTRTPHPATFGAHENRARTGHAGARAGAGGGSGVRAETVGMCAHRERMRGQRCQ